MDGPDDLLSLFVGTPPPQPPSPGVVQSAPPAGLGGHPVTGMSPVASLILGDAEAAGISDVHHVGVPLNAPEFTYKVDATQKENDTPPIEAQPITMYTTELAMSLARSVAVSRTFIAYGLKAGQIRVLHADTAVRALFRGHGAPITDMRFTSMSTDCDVLASASRDGRVFVRQVSSSNGGGEIEEKLVLAFTLAQGAQLAASSSSSSLGSATGATRDCPLVGDGTPAVQLAFVQNKSDVLIVAVDRYVVLVTVAALAVSLGVGGAADAAALPTLDPSGTMPMGASLLLTMDAPITAVTVNDAGTKLAIASNGCVHTYTLDGQAVTSRLPKWSPHPYSPVCHLSFLPSSVSRDEILLTGGAANKQIKLWTYGDSSAINTQTVNFISTKDEYAGGNAVVDIERYLSMMDSPGVFNHVCFDPKRNMLVVANSRTSAMYCLVYRPEMAAFVALAEYELAMPILSLTIGETDDSEKVPIFCVQTQSIQHYTVSVATSEASEEGMSSAETFWRSQVSSAIASAAAATFPTKTEEALASPPAPVAPALLTPEALLRSSSDTVATATSPSAPAPGPAPTVPAPAPSAPTVPAPVSSSAPSLEDGGLKLLTRTGVASTGVASASSSAAGDGALAAELAAAVKRIEEAANKKLDRALAKMQDAAAKAEKKREEAERRLIESMEKRVDKAMDRTSKRLEEVLNHAVEASSVNAARTMQAAFRTCLAESLVPAFDAAAREMMGQVAKALVTSVGMTSAVSSSSSGASMAPASSAPAHTPVPSPSPMPTTSMPMMPAPSVGPTPTPASPAAVMPECLRSIAAQLGESLTAANFNEAFQQVLSLTELEGVVYMCRTCEPSAAAPELSQLVLLSLLSQLNTYMQEGKMMPGTPESSAVLSWIAEGAEAVDPSDQQFSAAARSILDGLNQTLRDTLTSVPGHADYNAVRRSAMAVHLALRAL